MKRQLLIACFAGALCNSEVAADIAKELFKEGSKIATELFKDGSKEFAAYSWNMVKESALDTLVRMREQGGLSKAEVQEKRRWLWNEPDKTMGTYDMILNTENIESIMDVRSGWPMMFRDEAVVDKLLNVSMVKVGIIGNYNRGKTTLLNKLAGKDVKVGNLVHTVGLSLVFKEDFAFFDTAGENQPLPLNDVNNSHKEIGINQRLLGGLFLQNLVQDLADVLVVVVNQLSLEDQRYIRKLEKKMHSTFQRKSRSMLIVHNFKDVETAEDLNALIWKDIIEGFDAAETKISGRTVWKKDGIMHAVLAREGSDAAKIWNVQSLDFISSHIEEKKTMDENELRMSILERICNFTEAHVPIYFTHVNKADFADTADLKTRKRLGLIEGPPRLVIAGEGVNKAKLKRDAQIVEWEIQKTDTEKYKAEYEVLTGENETVLRVDLPGVFKDSGCSNSITMISNPKAGSDQRQFAWIETDDKGNKQQTVQLTLRLVQSGGKGPGIELKATRRDMAKETKTERVYENAANRGPLILPLDFLDEKLFPRGSLPDKFQNAIAKIEGNGVMEIRFQHIEEEEWDPLGQFEKELSSSSHSEL